MTTIINASTSNGLVQTGDGSGILELQSNGTSGAKVNGSNFQFNSGYGSVATAYACRAWVNFNGTGTVAIRGSGNVSSITDLGTGNYRTNFATAMPDSNYSCSTIRSIRGTGSYNDNIAHLNTDAPSTSSFSVWCHNQGTAADLDYVFLSFHR